MSQQFMLIESNPELGLRNDIYEDIREPYRDSIISDNFSEAILAIFDKADDKSLFRLDLDLYEQSSNHHPSLASQHYQFLQGLNLEPINTVLDISEDLGGVAHFLADQVGQIESIKIDPGLAHIAKVRCANKHNTCHISADLDKLNYPSKHYDLIVLGQLERLDLDRIRLRSLLKKLRASLSDRGVLILSAVNSNRSDRWLNTNSIHFDNKLEYADLYHADTQHGGIKEINRKALRDIVLDANFADTQLYATFANGNQTRAIFSADYLTANVNIGNHFYNLGTVSNPDINEFLVYQRLLENKNNLLDFASRFVIFAGASSTSIDGIYQQDFCHFANVKYKPEWQMITSRRRAAQTVEKFRYCSNIFDQSDQDCTSSQPNVTFNSQEFLKGHLLVRDWLNALLLADHRQFARLVEEYSDWLISQEQFNHTHGGAATPMNIIVTERKNHRQLRCFAQAIPLNFSLADAQISKYLLFRALLRLVKENLTLVRDYARKMDIPTIGGFIIEYMPSVNQIKELDEFADLEDSIESALYRTQSRNPDTNNSSTWTPLKILLSSTFSIDNSTFNQQLALETSSGEQLSQLIDQQNNALIGQTHQLKRLHLDIEHQDRRIKDLYAHRAELVERLKDQKEQKDYADDLEMKLRAEIDSLHERLHTQNVRNAELHGYLLMRPSTRASRVARRTLNRITGQVEEPIEEAIEEETLEEPIEIEQKEDTRDLPMQELIGQNTENYQLWISENTLTEAEIEAAKKEIETMEHKPVFSILVPIYNTEPQYLLPMIKSVQNQIYPHWQLCLVDDCSPKPYLKPILEHEALKDKRISIQLNEINQGISLTTNDALSMAQGEYIALLDHDDEISIDALYENAKVINKTPDAGLIYSDEDKIDMKGQRVEPYFKPDYSPDLLHTNNYICHFTVIKKSIADEIGGFREGLDGSQDHDIIIRAAARAKDVVHIPKILYHWRKIPGSTAVTYDSKSYAWEAGRKAVEDQLQKDEVGVRVEFGSLKGTYRVFRDILNTPLVTIIVPFKDKPELLDSCLESILNKSSYENFEILGISNNSSDEKTFERMAYYSALDSRVRFEEKNIPFNFSALCNHGVSQANGDYVILLNNDIEIRTTDWIERLLEHAQRDNIGAVGGKLLYPDGRIQHAGVVVGMVGAAGHPHKFFPDEHIGYHGRLHMVYNVSAVTGAMLMVSKAKFQQVGGLNEQNLAVAYNDIDLCLKLLEQGYLNLFTPHAKAMHYESVSRGYEDTEEKQQRFLLEQRYFLETWSEFLSNGDPYYNPNLSLKNERFSLRFKD